MSKYSFQLQPLTAYLDSLEELHQIPGVDMIIYKDGEQIYRHSNGHSDYDKKTPVSDKDLYHIYSASKISTCIGTLKLVEDGVIGLDDPVSKYLPEYANITVKTENGPVPVKNTMTVRHLLSMQGGLDYNIYRGKVMDVVKEKKDSVTTKDIANAFATAPLDFEPGTHFAYSLCHDALGGVIEAATGMLFSEYLKKAIFDPLEMYDTTFHPTEEQKARITAQYTFNSNTGKIEPTAYSFGDGIPSTYEAGGAGIVTSVNDYIKLIAALANKGTGLNGYKLLKPETVKLYSTPQLGEESLKDSLKRFEQQKGYTYGLGCRIFIDDKGSTCALGHFGWDGAAGTYCMIDTENNLAYVYAQQVTNHNDVFLNIHAKLRDMVYLCLR